MLKGFSILELNEGSWWSNVIRDPSGSWQRVHVKWKNGIYEGFRPCGRPGHMMLSELNQEVAEELKCCNSTPPPLSLSWFLCSKAEGTSGLCIKFHFISYIHQF